MLMIRCLGPNVGSKNGSQPSSSAAGSCSHFVRLLHCRKLTLTDSHSAADVYRRYQRGKLMSADRSVELIYRTSRWRRKRNGKNRSKLSYANLRLHRPMSAGSTDSIPIDSSRRTITQSKSRHCPLIWSFPSSRMSAWTSVLAPLWVHWKN